MTAYNFSSGLIKQATLGGEQEAGFEQAFSSLAYAYLKDKAPRLLDNVVGFQLVDRNEDNTKAVGVFGFKLGDRWLYAPVFFLNGDIKGHELLYIKNQDMFVPLKENWVNYITSRRPHVLGEGSNRDTQQLGGLQPQLYDMIYPPTHRKRGSDRFEAFQRIVREGLGRGTEKIAAWAEPGVILAAAGLTKKARFVYTSAEKGGDIDMSKLAAHPFAAVVAGLGLNLNDFLGHNVHLAKLAYELTQQFPAIKQGMDRFHGPDFFVELSRQFRQRAKQAADNILRQAANNDAQREKVRLWDRQSASSPSGVARLSESQRSKIAAHGYLIEDERTGDEVSIAFETQVENRLTNPSDTGIYQVLEKPGKFSRMLVVHAPLGCNRNKRALLVVRLDDNKKNKSFSLLPRTDVWTNDIDDDGDDYAEWFNNLSSDDPKESGIYMAVTENGQATVPFEVLDDLGGGEYNIHAKYHVEQSLENTSPIYDGEDINEFEYPAKLRIGDEQRTQKILVTRYEIRLPQGAKIFKLTSPRRVNERLLVAPSTPEADSPISPGQLVDVESVLAEKTARMKLYGDHHEVTVYTEKRGFERYPYQQALYALVRDHGLREDSANEMLKRAQAKGSGIFRVKYAYGFPRGQGPNAPAFPEAERGTEPVGYGSVDSIYPQEEFIEVDGLQASMTDPSVYDPFDTPDPRTMQVAQQAGQTGQKEVFDTAMIGGLLKVVRQDSLVDRYLGDLMKAMDRLGRILFLFYWHGEEFEDRYGKSDTPELEDSLRNAFESLGDLTLFLKEKTIEGPAAEIMGDLDLEDVARN